MPYLKEIRLEWARAGPDQHPWNLPAIQRLQRIPFDKNVTIFVGENGSGKSTLLESIASHCGFNLQGGSRNASLHVHEAPLSDMLSLSWLPKITKGFFLRAESFYDYATYLDEMEKEHPGHGTLLPYGGASLHSMSRGESLLSLFKNRFGSRSFLILDEPEAALSPKRQLQFIGLLKRLELELRCQVLIATHSPILIGYPGATIWSLDFSPMRRVSWKQTSHFQLTKSFLLDRDRVIQTILDETIDS